MSWTAGEDLDIRTLGAAAFPIDTINYVADSNYPAITPTLCQSLGKFWVQVTDYWEHGTLPPGTRVICGIPIANPSGNLTLARAACTYAGATYAGTDTDVDVCVDTINYVDAPWNVP